MDETKTFYIEYEDNYDMKEIEEKEIFFLGCKELYFFLKKIEILK